MDPAWPSLDLASVVGAAASGIVAGGVDGVAACRTRATRAARGRSSGTARRILLGMPGRPQGWTTTIRSDEGLRRIVLTFIADFANRDHAANRTYIEVSVPS